MLWVVGIFMQCRTIVILVSAVGAGVVLTTTNSRETFATLAADWSGQPSSPMDNPRALILYPGYGSVVVERSSCTVLSSVGIEPHIAGETLGDGSLAYSLGDVIPFFATVSGPGASDVNLRWTWTKDDIVILSEEGPYLNYTVQPEDVGNSVQFEVRVQAALGDRQMSFSVQMRSSDTSALSPTPQADPPRSHGISLTGGSLIGVVAAAGVAASAIVYGFVRGRRRGRVLSGKESSTTRTSRGSSEREESSILSLSASPADRPLPSRRSPGGLLNTLSSPRSGRDLGEPRVRTLLRLLNRFD
jgi:hypothetical protein